jgi:hypothetical protein
VRYGTQTDLPVPDVIRQAVDLFGAAGHGLTVIERDMLTVKLANQVGHVAVEVSRTDDHRTVLTIETREYDREVQTFIQDLPRYSRLRRAWRRRRSGS